MEIPTELMKCKMLMQSDVNLNEPASQSQQPALDLDSQVANLRSLNLIVPDEKQCKDTLDRVSYYRLVKAYGGGLKPHNGIFDGSVTFNDLVALYDFNRKFRQLILAYIEIVEVTLRSRLSNYFCIKYGVLGYERHKNFADRNKHKQFLEEAYETIVRNRRSPFVRNFQTKYEGRGVPFYALVEIMSFGLLSKFFKNMKNRDKKALATLYGHSWPYLESWFESLAYLRNVCAHCGRLYDIKLERTPRFPKSTRGGQWTSTIRVFSSVYCISKLVPHDDEWTLFLLRLSGLFRKYPQVDIHKIGFPENWHDLLA